MKTSERDTWVFGEAKRRVLLMDSGMCKKWHVLHVIKLTQQVLINRTLRCDLPNTITTLYFIFSITCALWFIVQLKS